MKISSIRLIVTFGLCVLAFVIGIFVGKATLSSPAQPVVDSELAKLGPQIQDAIRRWSSKTEQSEQTVRESYKPRSMFIPTRNQGQGMVCIELAFEPGGVGGSPVYCYQDDFFKRETKIKLVAEYSDVE
jgi:hypothetical protein